MEQNRISRSDIADIASSLALGDYLAYVTAMERIAMEQNRLALIEQSFPFAEVDQMTPDSFFVSTALLVVAIVSHEKEGTYSLQFSHGHEGPVITLEEGFPCLEQVIGAAKALFALGSRLKA